jgi:hypothetical protein
MKRLIVVAAMLVALAAVYLALPVAAKGATHVFNVLPSEPVAISCGVPISHEVADDGLLFSANSVCAVTYGAGRSASVPNGDYIQVRAKSGTLTVTATGATSVRVGNH